ncbi:MAG TPA: hypothetical protein VE710_06800 [Candidatus Bathyarchaeia archaeon]|nr:hypothetical protein [Candidatus Bathyarchaeia archaeon]
MTTTANKYMVKDVYLEKEKDEDWKMIVIDENDQTNTLVFADTSTLSRAIHQMTHMLPMKRLKEEDKQELIFAMEQIMPHIYRNYILDEYVLD